MYRVGHGYDVHRLTVGRDLILGGVKIEHDKGLLGHSDADVLLHAICDALLGAAALRDIGFHFPDSDEKYRGISSLLLLSKTALLLRERGFEICNVDSTVIAQSPKLSPYIPRMIENISKTLDIPQECVNVKATTEERLGFSGQGKGIAAHAVAMIRTAE